MEKIRITICCGTYCHVMGGAELQNIREDFPNHLLPHIECRFSPCLDYCREDYGKPPFALVDGKCIPEASLEKIRIEVEHLLAGKKNGSK